LNGKFQATRYAKALNGSTPKTKTIYESFFGRKLFLGKLGFKTDKRRVQGNFSVVGLPLDANGLTRPESEPF